MDFDREATMLSGLKHENIVTLYGVSVDRQPHMIILEYMEFGDLCNFLRYALFIHFFIHSLIPLFIYLLPPSFMYASVNSIHLLPLFTFSSDILEDLIAFGK